MKLLATFISLTIVFCLQLEISAQITWNFNTAGSGAVSTTPALPANITAASAVTQVNSTITAAASMFAAPTPLSSGYPGASGTNNASFIAKTGVLNTSTTTYLQFSITPAPNNWVNITNINWGNLSLSTTGPTAFAIYTSVDNYASPVFVTGPAIPANSTWSQVNTATSGTAMSPINSLTGTQITIRIYAYGGVGVTPSGTATANANWRVDDIKVTATAQTGTQGQIPKYNGTAAFSNSVINESMAGNIGIGVAGPTGVNSPKLEINGQIKITGGAPGQGKVLTSIDGTGLASWQPASGGSMVYPPAGIPVSTGTAWGASLTNTTIGSNLITATNPSAISFLRANADNTVSFLDAANFRTAIGVPSSQWANSTGNDIYNSNSGNVGIGTSTPTEKLEVSGTIKTTGLIIPTNAGLNTILTSDASGNATWQTPAPVITSYWGLNGNAGTNSSSNFIGTSDNQSLSIRTNNTERLTIASTGEAIFKTPLSFDGEEIAFAINGGTTNGNLLLNLFEQKKSGSWRFRSATGGEILAFQASNGSLYSGPGLDVDFTRSGSVYGNNFGASKFRGLAWFQTEIGIDAPSITYKSVGANWVPANTSAHKFTVVAPLTQSGTNIATFDNGGNALMTITKEGNVSIGTTTPTEKLDVSGNIKATQNIFSQRSYIGDISGLTTQQLETHKLFVEGSALFVKAVVKNRNTWPDYVFNNDYKLPTLAEVEKYIKANKHLPEIPSADEVKKNGIDLGNNQTLLLKKVEELTLYIIEQNKKIELLQAEKEKITHLQVQIDELKKLIKEQKK